ncbi:bifunctional diguanylate cyclase/phosphodiesterase [Blastococcus sp. TF02A-26]|uniref:putative bifunctional diguanylate cyclase/phosphodiesterase n=1 Tax=Blastococcus sp. TF02A-26 TaxID=2250577 RepID=UPI0013148B49|nr:bifunctional diguanylate cyclase/phosphodiesterase [Blastococcus sp. TF02A-26]
MQLSSDAPEIATPRVMARTAGAFYAAAGCAAFTVVAGAGAPGGGPGRTLAGLALLAVATGAVLLWRGDRLPRGAFHGVVLAGTALLTVAIAVSPDAPTAVTVAYFTSFIAVDCFFFFAWRPALAHLVGLLLGPGAALLSQPDVHPGIPIAIGTVCIVVSLVVGGLVRQASNASRDPLTGLLNRRGFDDALETALAAGDRTGQPLALALLDVDRFKTVNDTRGHAAGDELLRALAAACLATVPAGTTVARLGGDEFALLMPHCSASAALARVEAVRVAVTDCGISCGVAVRAGQESAAELLRRADTALYAAKDGGRGRAVFSGGDTSVLAVELAAALTAGRIGVALQPIVALTDGSVIGVEALARWHDSVRGSVPPDEFVPAAEDAGLVADLGRAVLTTACRDARVLAAHWGRRLMLTVNVSGQELAAPGYARHLFEVLHRTGWSPEDLVVEVTETLIASPNASLETLAELRAGGVAVAIDDFGTGFSSFSRLDTLPADYLKLDPSFMATTTTSPRRAAMLHGLLTLSATLGLSVIAEGVETAEQEALLERLGAPLAQGHRYGAPRSVDALLLDVPAREATPA